MVKYVTLLVIIVFSSSDGRLCARARRKPKVCQTKGCIDTAKNLRKYMDLKIDPCDNFYQFACGKFIRETHISGDKSVIGPLYDIQDDIYRKLIDIIQKPYHHDEAKPFVLVKKLYKTCMDKTQRETVGNKPLKDILKTLGGGWPVRHSNVDWKVLIYKLRKLGYPVDTLINLKIGIDPSNSTKGIIVLTQPDKFGLFKKEFRNRTKVRMYYKEMIKAARILGAEEELASEALKDALKFELKLVKNSISFEWLRIARTSKELMTIAELQKRYPSIDWLQYITKILNIRSIKITKHERILVKTPGYIKRVLGILKYSNRTAVANYIMWRAVDFSYIKSELRMARKGTLSKPRDRRCIRDVAENIPLATESFYIRKFFNESMRHSARKIVKKLKSAFGGMLNKTQWLDEVTKRYALEKLDSMKSRIGYDDQLVDDQILKEYYLDLQLYPDNYLIQILKVLRFKQNKEFSRLRKNQNGVDWTRVVSPLTVSAKNNLYNNKIDISAEILQGFAFSKGTPKYMSYGSIGAIIGHEITHGFDDQGRTYNKDGNAVNWWTDEASKEFDEKVSCLINQYSSIAVPEADYMHLNGKKSIGENIADNGGVRAAYEAYKNLAKHEPYLPHFNYSPNQMFWISYAYKGCAKYRPEALKHQMLSDDPHMPKEFRILVPLRNSEAFAKDFNCPLGYKMNPSEKCRLW